MLVFDVCWMLVFDVCVGCVWMCAPSVFYDLWPPHRAQSPTKTLPHMLGNVISIGI